MNRKKQSLIYSANVKDRNMILFAQDYQGWAEIVCNINRHLNEGATSHSVILADMNI